MQVHVLSIGGYALTSSVICTKGHLTRQVACAKGLVACYIPPSTHNMPKNISRNALGEKELQQYSLTICPCNVRVTQHLQHDSDEEYSKNLLVSLDKWALGHHFSIGY